MNAITLNKIKSRVNTSWWMLKLTYGLVFVAAGADKFINLLTDWEKYVNPYLLKLIPVTAVQLMRGVGIVEIVIGIITLSALTRLGARLTAIWLMLIALNLVAMLNYLDVAVRDIVMAVGAIRLVQLTSVREDLEKN